MIFYFEIEKLTKENDNFRNVIKTGKYSQVVLMSLKPGEDIGNEVHETVDQILVFVEGEGKAKVGDEEFEIKPGVMAFVDAGTWHNFTNIGTGDMKLYTIYSPANHPADRVQKDKPAVDDD
ncbi:cupin domain-containing protein [Candidatus Wolfebacteria bacterium]|nr:cupin domain-containing protein [Candidatus Wolfebacteria bacterium]